MKIILETKNKKHEKNIIYIVVNFTFFYTEN